MKYKSALIGGLAFLLNSCSPNLSTPKDTVKTMFEYIKKDKDPFEILGYTECKRDWFCMYIYKKGDMHPSSQETRDWLHHYFRYSNLDDIFSDQRCDDNFCDIILRPIEEDENGVKYVNRKSLEIKLQKEKDGWKITSMMY